ncbi:MAG: DUF3995 domain-containing protein [Ginsengibacter sp.]
MIFLFLSSIHIYWGLGGKWSNDAAIPTKANNKKIFRPSAFSTFIVALGLLSFGLFILIKAEVLNFKIPFWLDKFGLWIIASIFIIRAIGEFNYVGFFKKIKHTQFGRNDTKYYSPLCLIIGILNIIIELNK